MRSCSVASLSSLSSLSLSRSLVAARSSLYTASSECGQLQCMRDASALALRFCQPARPSSQAPAPALCRGQRECVPVRRGMLQILFRSATRELET